MNGPVAMILAGGTARRMGGGDKGLARLGASTLLGGIAARVAPQVAALALNANGDPARFGHLGLEVVPDGENKGVQGGLGPLAGILAAMEWAALRGADRVVTVPGDTPFLPGDLVPCLHLVAGGSGCAVARSGGQMHPICGLWSVNLAQDLRVALQAGTRKVQHWTAAQHPAIADFPLTEPDGFFNVNTPADLARAEAWIGMGRES